MSRWRWLFTAVASALIGSTVLMFFAGLGNGLGAGIALGEPQTIVRAHRRRAGATCLRWRCWPESPRWRSRCGMTWIGWLAVTFVVISLYLGALLRLPRWLIDLSPVGRTTAPMDHSCAGDRGDGRQSQRADSVAGAIYRRRDAA